MAKPKEFPCFSVDVPDRPGTLAAFLNAMREAKVNLKGVWGYSLGPGGQAKIMAVPQNPAKFEKACQKAGYQAEPLTVFGFFGPDKIGALCTTLDRIAQAGVNLHAVDGIAVGGKFGCYVWTSAEDAKKVKGLF